MGLHIKKLPCLMTFTLVTLTVVVANPLPSSSTASSLTTDTENVCSKKKVLKHRTYVLEHGHLTNLNRMYCFL